MSKFKFWCPVDITKAKDDKGEEVLRLGGIASTMDKDSDGEFLDPSGFDISEFKKSGVVNWHHQAKNSPATIIGEPSKAVVQKDGFYVETDLYKSSELAREVYELAQTMAKDSKTRRLGYSIEGQVIERDELNPKIVKKAIITGLAITHMPKNPKTFADIIKGHVEEDEEEKSLDTTSGAALVRESVDGYKVRKMDEEVKFDTIFDTFPDISIEKAQKVYEFLNKIEEAMAKGRQIKTEDLEKAMAHLGLGNLDDNPFIEKAKSGESTEGRSEMTPEQIAEGVQKETYGDEGEDSPETTTVEKGAGETDILKAIGVIGEVNTKGVRALAKLVKAQMDEVHLVKGQLEQSLNDNLETKQLLQKAIDKIDAMSKEPVGRRSVTNGFAQRTDGEGNPFIEKGQNSNPVGERNAPALDQKNNKKYILEILDQATFAKGNIDTEFEKAMLGFEAGKPLTPSVISRLRTEYGVNVRS